MRIIHLDRDWKRARRPIELHYVGLALWRVKDREIIVFLFDHWVSGEIAWQHVVHGIFLMVYGIGYVIT